MNNFPLPPADNDEGSLQAALEEYIAQLDDAAGDDLRARLACTPGLFETLAKALSEMALFIAAAHVVEDDDEFEAMADTVLAEAVLDNADVQRLRTYYLEHADQMEFAADTLPAAMVTQRIGNQLAAYQILHATSLWPSR